MVTNTTQLINTVKKMYPVAQFFKDRYFPDGKSFHSDEVLIECKKGGREIAPFVVPFVNGIAMRSRKYSGYKFTPPYIAPKSVITVQDLRNKAFGEDPNSGRSAESRENEVQAERMDDLRAATLRRFEQMCAEILTTGSCVMKHYAKPDDYGTEKYKTLQLTFYEDEFENKYALPKDWKSMSVQEKIMVFNSMARVMKRRGVKVTDLVLGSDVSTDLFADIDFLEYFDKKNVNFGAVDQQELPEGVTFNGTINVMGIMLNIFTYDEMYEDIDETMKEFIPSGAIMMLAPGMGTTAYGPVDFVGSDGAVHSYAEKLVPRVRPDDDNNLITVHMYSRPVPYPLDFEGWLIADINAEVATVDEPETAMYSAGDGYAGTDVIFKTVDEINAMTKKAEVIAYAESIGLSGLTDASSLTELKEAVIDYQDELAANAGE